MTLQQLLEKLRAKELEAIENGGVAEVHFIDLADAQRAIVELIERDSDMRGGFRIGQIVEFKGERHAVFDVDEGYGMLALDGDKYISPGDSQNRCIEAPMNECKPADQGGGE